MDPPTDRRHAASTVQTTNLGGLSLIGDAADPVWSEPHGATESPQPGAGQSVPVGSVYGTYGAEYMVIGGTGQSATRTEGDSAQRSHSYAPEMFALFGIVILLGDSVEN